MNFLEARATALFSLREKLHAESAKAPVNNPLVPPHLPLVDQVRNLLATLPPAQKNRISLPAILPHLRGKYREVPNHVHVARALRILGYERVRSFARGDDGCRLWIAPGNN